MTASLISYAGMEEQPAKRAKLGGFTTSSSIFTTQGAVGSSVLSNAEYPAMHAHYDNPTVNASISPIVQNIMMDTSGFDFNELIKGEDDLDADTLSLFNSWTDSKGDPNWTNLCGVPFDAEYDKNSNTYKLNESGTKIIIFCEPPVKIKKNLYQVSRVVGGVASIQNFIVKITFEEKPQRKEDEESVEAFNARKLAFFRKQANCKPGQYISEAAGMSMVYHQPDSDGKHKVILQLTTAL